MKLLHQSAAPSWPACAIKGTAAARGKLRAALLHFVHELATASDYLSSWDQAGQTDALGAD